MGIGSIGMTELIIILSIVILIFGGRKIPELAKGLGKGIREFKKASTGADEIPSSSKSTDRIEPGEKQEEE